MLALFLSNLMVNSFGIMLFSRY